MALPPLALRKAAMSDRARIIIAIVGLIIFVVGLILLFHPAVGGLEFADPIHRASP